MRGPLEDALRRLLRPAVWAAFVVAVAAVDDGASSSPGPREYASGTWSRNFFRPREVQIDGVGLVNEDAVFVATRSGVKSLHKGLLTPLIEVAEEEVRAFHLCHHRGSFFYEVLSRDGGALSIYEYSLSARQKSLVMKFQDALPATALACVDQWLLLASASTFQAVHLPTGTESEIRRFQDREGSETISSISVAFSADVVGRAEVYVAVPGNHSILRLRLRDDGDGRLKEESSEPLVSAGDGSDGPVGTATANAPQQLLWMRGQAGSAPQVLFTDGCSLRELRDGHVRTLLGKPDVCVSAGNETLEPVPWASRLSRPRALAGASEGTARGAVLLLTEAQVVRVFEETDACRGRAAAEAERGEARCDAEHSGCAWAQGQAPGEGLCFECAALERWTSLARPLLELCDLDGTAGRAGTRYSLAGCGCTPVPSPEPDGPGRAVGDGGAGSLQAALSGVLVVGLAILGVLLYRRSRRAAAMRELYGVDTAEFHTFTDNERLH